MSSNKPILPPSIPILFSPTIRITGGYLYICHQSRLRQRGRKSAEILHPRQTDFLGATESLKSKLGLTLFVVILVYFLLQPYIFFDTSPCQAHLHMQCMPMLHTATSCPPCPLHCFFHVRSSSNMPTVASSSTAAKTIKWLQINRGITHHVGKYWSPKSCSGNPFLT